MKSENYIRLNEFIKSHDNIKKAVIFIDKNFHSKQNNYLRNREKDQAVLHNLC